MNKYVHAVGLCIGLTAVIVLSAIDGACLSGGHWSESLARPYFTPRAYMLGWLFSYLLTALCFGEFVVLKRLRRLIFLPILLMTFTAMYFFTLFRAENLLLATVFMSLASGVQAVLVGVNVKNSRLAAVAGTVNLAWYLLMSGLAMAVLLLNY